MADLKITVDKSELVGLIKTTDQTKQAVRLMAAEFSRTGNQSAYLRSINQVVTAQNKLPAAMRMSRKEIMALGQQYRQQVAFTDELTRAQMQLNAATQRSARGMNRSGVIMQQTGYQVGDFLVQVQSGTNAFVAFGQQATQVAGTLTMLGGKFILIGSVLGVAIPLITALAAGYMRTRDAANSSASAVDRSAEAIKSLREESERAAIEVQALVEGFKNVDEYLASLEIRDLNEQIRDLTTQLTDLQYAQWIGPDDVALQEKFTQEQIDALEARRAEIQALITESALRRDRAEAEELYTENLRQQNRLIEERQEAVERIVKNYEQELATQQNLLDLAQVAATYGEESAEYAQLVAEQEREAYQLRLMSNGILGDNLTQIMAYYDQVVAINEILAKPVQGPVLPTTDADTTRAVRNIQRTVRANDEVTESIQRINDISESMADNFGKAFTSVIDGTSTVKDAFKSMARSIIAELYQIFVVKQITGFIAGALQSAFTGGLAPATSPVPTPAPRASGGMMNPNEPYLVGERGPELVMPNRQSTVMNADLTKKALGGGSGETIVVNQTINVSTGVQQTVRNEIQNLMPQISEAAKSAVVDAKRRGGSYGRAFG